MPVDFGGSQGGRGLGEIGAQQAQDYSVKVGTVAGAPLKISWFVFLFFAYQLVEALKRPDMPIWVRVVELMGVEFILLTCVLVHELGHGTMARHLGGDIVQILLWPFGGICFSRSPQDDDARDQLRRQLKIASAGPATHFPQGALWLAALAAAEAALGLVGLQSVWWHLVPFANPRAPCLVVDEKYDVPGCLQSYSAYLLYRFLAWGVQMNVISFVFNVFFPMYPMDGAKLIVCSLQLFCGVPAKCAAKVLIGTSVPLAVLFIGFALKGLGGGGLQPGITAYMGFMCLSESYTIYKLMKEERLYTHPLFGAARSSTREVVDSMGVTNRLNTSERDDEEAARAPQVQFTELRPFSGAGRSLGAGADEASASADLGKGGSVGGSGSEAAAGTVLGGGSSDARGAWLSRMEQQNAEKAKSVRQLEEERLERMERERLTANGASRAP
mmetsp:Transcript_68580/g.151862  ORF Transcript_68580/g.151862 Transcript_68580/m.151862 type:complete len:443 (+) Transcript_68580:78-1406(+)